MLNQKRSRIYKIWALIVAIIFFIGGIILGFVFETTEYTGSSLFSTPVAESHFNWTLMFILWVTGILPVLGIYAVYIHLDNQEKMLGYLQTLCPQQPAASTRPSVSHTMVSPSNVQQTPTDGVWRCKICGTENLSNTTVCAKCGWNAQPEKE